MNPTVEADGVVIEKELNTGEYTVKYPTGDAALYSNQTQAMQGVMAYATENNLSNEGICQLGWLFVDLVEKEHE